MIIEKQAKKNHFLTCFDTKYPAKVPISNTTVATITSASNVIKSNEMSSKNICSIPSTTPKIIPRKHLFLEDLYDSSYKDLHTRI